MKLKDLSSIDNDESHTFIQKLFSLLYHHQLNDFNTTLNDSVYLNFKEIGKIEYETKNKILADDYYSDLIKFLFFPNSKLEGKIYRDSKVEKAQGD